MEDTLYQVFAEVGEDHWWFRGRREIVRAILRETFGALPTTDRRVIVDVGCGTGAMLGMLTEFGEVRGLEPSPFAVEECKRRYGNEVTVRVGSIPDDLDSVCPADVVTAFDVIEHLDDDVAALRAIRECLVPEGLFVCTVPAYQWMWSRHDDLNHHKRRYTKGLLAEHLGAADFQIQRLTYFNTLLFPPIAAVRVLQRLAPKKGAREGRSDFALSPPRMNEFLTRTFGMEARIIRRRSLPLGVSLLAVASVSS